jgi:hypothetical protein
MAASTSRASSGPSFGPVKQIDAGVLKSATSKPVHRTGRRCCSCTAGPTTATQRPVAELAFSEPSGAPGRKDLPSWAVVATGDKAAGTDVVRSMAERAAPTSSRSRAPT